MAPPNQKWTGRGRRPRPVHAVFVRVYYFFCNFNSVISVPEHILTHGCHLGINRPIIPAGTTLHLEVQGAVIGAEPYSGTAAGRLIEHNTV